MKIPSILEYTLVKPDTTIQEVRKVCENAITLEFAAVCVPPYFVKEAARLLKDSRVRLATVIGYPYGYATIAGKVEEIKRAINDDVDELNVAINLCAVKNGDWTVVHNDIESMTRAAHLKGKRIKIFIELDLLTKKELEKVFVTCKKAEADFVMISVANEAEDLIETIKSVKLNLSKVKLAVYSQQFKRNDFQKLLDAGVNRISNALGNEIFASVQTN